MAEPLAVCLHAINQAGNIFGKKGPNNWIWSNWNTLRVYAARRAGAEEIVVTDISDNALSYSNSSWSRP